MRDAGTALNFLAASLLGKLPSGAPSATDQLTMIDTMNLLVMQSPKEALPSNSRCMPVLALLELASTKATPLKTRLRAFETLSAMMERFADDQDWLMSILPGVCSSLATVISKVETENHQVIIASLSILEKLLLGSLLSESLVEKLNGKIGILLGGLARAASLSKDERCLASFTRFTNALLEQPLFLPLSRYLINLAYQCKVDRVPESHLEAVKTFAEEVTKRADDTRSSEESRIESINYLAWLESFIDEDPIVLPRIFDMIEETLLKPKTIQLINNQDAFSLVHSSNFPIERPSLANLFGETTEELLIVLKQVMAKDESVNWVLSRKESSPVTVLLALSQTSSAILQPLIIDECIGIKLDEPADERLAHAFMVTITNSARLLKFDFGPYWRFILPDMLTWLSGPDPLSSSLAASCLNEISNCSGQPNFITVLKSNIDYVIDQLGLQIRCPTVYPFAPRIMAGLLRLVGCEVIGNIDCLLGEIMDNLAVYKNHDGYVYDLLGVLSQVGNFHFLTIGGFDEEDSTREKKIVQVPERIIMLVTHFMLSDRRKIRLRAMEVLVEVSKHAYKAGQDSFLPLVHWMWPALLGRVLDPNPDVGIVAFKSIVEVCQISGSFMQKRINQELWPVACKMHDQLTVMQCFSKISQIEGIKLGLKTIEGLTDILVARLDSMNGSEREAAVRLGESLILGYPDTMWFHLVCQSSQPLYHKIRPIPSCPALQHLISHIP